MTDLPEVKSEIKAIPLVEAKPTLAAKTPEEKLGEEFARIVSKSEVDLSDAIAEFVSTIEKKDATNDPVE